MKKLLSLILSLAFLFALTSCNNMTGAAVLSDDSKETYNVDLYSMEENKENSYIINWWDENVTTSTGVFYAKNLNDFPVTLHFTTPLKEVSFEIPAGEEKLIEDLEKDTSYQIGAHAEVEEKTPINLTLRDK